MSKCDKKFPTACLGKCSENSCATSRVWVLAACEGMLALFEKDKNNCLKPLPIEEADGASTMDQLRKRLIVAATHKDFSQLVLVGSANDISWAHAILPEEALKYIAAEINYPLVSGWFSRETNPNTLSLKIEHLFSH